MRGIRHEEGPQNIISSRLKTTAQVCPAFKCLLRNPRNPIREMLLPFLGYKQGN